MSDGGSIAVSVDGEHFRVVYTGDVDLVTVAEHREQVRGQVPAGSHVVVDLTDARFIDSAAVGLLVGLRNEAGSIELVGTQPRVLRVLQISGLAQIFGLEG